MKLPNYQQQRMAWEKELPSTQQSESRVGVGKGNFEAQTKVMEIIPEAA